MSALWRFLSGLVVPLLLACQVLSIITIGRLRDRIDLLSLGHRVTNCRVEMLATEQPCEDAEAIKRDVLAYAAKAGRE